MSHQATMTAYLSAFIEELIQAGVKEAVISPGSRSTPIALLMAEHPTLKIHVDVDERSAGFFALGIAKASKHPVVLLCTSGTAAANYFPAVAEANLSQIPLIVLTADRPHELRNVGAPQAMDQIELFGNHVKDMVDMAIPEGTNEMLRYAKWHGSRSVDIALKTPRGPVHLNFPLREPLTPILDPSPFTQTGQKKHHVRIYYTHEVLEQSALDKMFQDCSGKKGVIIAGPLDKKNLEGKLVLAAQKLGWPILADPLSGLRSYGEKDQVVIDQYDALLKNQAFQLAIEPEMVVRFGAMPVSKSLKIWLESLDVRTFVVDPGAAWRDPVKGVTDMIHCDERFLLEELTQAAFDVPENWLSVWQKLNKSAQNVLSSHMKEGDLLEEGQIVSVLREHLPDQSGLFIGNSMPIRDVDTYFMQTDKRVKMLANRGANGIDGVVSAALGASTVLQPMYLLIGDLSFYHDMNGLLMAKKYRLNLTIIVVNNDGGGIFSFLPQAGTPKYFESLFGTSTNLDFSHAAALYDASYEKITRLNDLEDALDKAAFRKGLNIIEVRTNRHENVAHHQALWEKMAKQVERDLTK
ncbi:2-succinyl-5-enolpyruvyl-6-hydroxy-3-cyclohexene-1-carboxylic-acid synthase [Listeria fleischmannii]|uniref:2-succinyl-5-enolpyruvyl-6-hydroxy-3- cyclohexene-1-carboxylic-acid synthase n=1 Tax=Listeria fleischmannii TaxID=1069827 RepID=UPI0016287866|nr:2-succinyl-5-enolpyruvyl-6-hydroxy-3-cyclohexene-1-carboxylic-acid synthase [Listeria fleischmannii]MBC1419999.1 2-succinyl-5-enolpyruvyl-6-hydroxy-3-cyclohexene-1-carboxylic-acid synthase [Listeria fleischmannii]